MTENSTPNGSSNDRSAGRITTIEDADLLDELTPVSDFADKATRSSFFKPVVTCVLATLLSIGVAAGVLTTASSRATAQDSNHVIVDSKSTDESKAKPLNGQLDQLQNQNNDEIPAGLTDFGARDTSTSRNSVRNELTKAITASAGEDAASNLAGNTKQLTDAQAQAARAKLIKQLDVDVANAKAKAKAVAAERERAKKLLAEAAAKRAKNGEPSGTQPDGTGVDTSSVTNVSNGKGSLPLRSGTYTLSARWKQYGVWARWHTGQDFAAACGTPIYAVADAVVGSSVSAYWPGTNVVLHHSNGGSTLYAHMTTKVAMPGQQVKAGQLIGYVGNTGNSFGCHTHFEYYPAGTTPGDVYSTGDPIGFLRSLGVNP